MRHPEFASGPMVGALDVFQSISPLGTATRVPDRVRRVTDNEAQSYPGEESVNAWNGLWKIRGSFRWD
jgi:hypothetical protein